MFICSMRMSKKKMLAILIAVILVVGGIACFITMKGKQEGMAEHKSGSEVSLKFKETADLVAYVQSFGWEIETEPSEVVEVTVPKEFNEVYENYNTLQKKQGFDLVAYQGKLVTRTTFIVTNYPNYPENIRADVLTCEGMIIGGDICSIEISGFMHGLDETSPPEGTQA